jgi:dTDP-4-amino-4,6-dideoxygalactose transaminase
LPIYPDLTRDEAERVASAVEEVVRQSQERILMAS